MERGGNMPAGQGAATCRAGEPAPLLRYAPPRSFFVNDGPEEAHRETQRTAIAHRGPAGGAYDRAARPGGRIGVRPRITPRPAGGGPVPLDQRRGPDGPCVPTDRPR